MRQLRPFPPKPISLVVLVGMLAVAMAMSACGSSDAGDIATRRVATETTAMGGDLPATELHRSEERAASLNELAKTSTRVVVGTVSALTSLGFPDSEQDPNASEYFRVDVESDRDLKGKGAASFVWEGFISDGKGNRMLRVIQDGVEMPQVGERIVVFLKPPSEGAAKIFGADVAEVNTLDGILTVDANDALRTKLAGTDRVAHELSGMSVEDLASSLGA